MKKICLSLVGLTCIFAIIFQGSAEAGNPDIVIYNAKNKFLARGCKDKQGHWCVIKGGHPNVPDVKLKSSLY